MFNYKSKRELLRYLGQLDGLVQLNEIALRNFKETYPEKDDLKSALSKGSDAIKVKVSYIEWPDFFDRFYRELINSVYSAFEKFYDLHWAELQIFINYYISIVQQKPAISENTIDLFNYYHRLRNDTVHPERSEPKKTLKFYDTVDLEKTKVEFNAIPNKPDFICFDDYLLYSKVTKKICAELSDNILPSSEHIIQLIPKKFLADKNAHRKITEFLRREYGLDKTEIQEILTLIEDPVA